MLFEIYLYYTRWFNVPTSLPSWQVYQIHSKQSPHNLYQTHTSFPHLFDHHIPRCYLNSPNIPAEFFTNLSSACWTSRSGARVTDTVLLQINTKICVGAGGWCVKAVGYSAAWREMCWILLRVVLVKSFVFVDEVLGTLVLGSGIDATSSFLVIIAFFSWLIYDRGYLSHLVR